MRWPLKIIGRAFPGGQVFEARWVDRFCGTTRLEFFTLPAMLQNQIRYRQPTVDEQHVLEHLTVRLVQPHKVERFDQLILQHHYLKNPLVVGEHPRYVATYKGQWVGLAPRRA